MTKIYPTLYKVDSAGKVRVWSVEQDGDKYRVRSGLEGGGIVESEWKVAVPKNIGRSNETTGEQQAASEIESLYADKKSRGAYSESKTEMLKPKYFEPMLAERFDKLKKIDAIIAAGVWSQPKLDGFRCIVDVDSGMMSRSGKPFVSSPHIIEALQPLLDDFPDIVLDGELYNHDLRDNFNKLQSLVNRQKPTLADFTETFEKVQYHIYDAFFPGQPDLDFKERFNLLKQLLEESGVLCRRIVLVRTDFVDSLDEVNRLQSEYLADRYEGQILRVDAAYENKRTKSLIKRKEFFDEEFEIVAIEEGIGNWAGAAKRVRCRDRESGEIFEATPRGTYEEMVDLLADRERYIGGECTVRYPNKTPERNIPRFGIVTALYEGKRDI